jgi:hypothetical protein
MVMGGASSATAEDGPWNIAQGADLDAMLDAQATTNLDDEQGNTQELGPLNSNTTKIGVIHNDAVPTLGTTNPNAQVDLRQAWLDIKRDGGKDWLYFAWERDKATGSGFIAFEFMRNAAPAACGTFDTSTQALVDQLIANCNPWSLRQGGNAAATPPVAGDFMILWDQQGGGLDLALRKWSGTAPNLVLGAPIDLELATSQAAISEDGFFGEAAVNLTDTIFGGSLQCLSFANVIPSTVTGNSDTADYKDTILKRIPPISNCTTTVTTTPQTAAGADITAPLSIGTGVVAVKDSADIVLEGGTGTPGGSVTFWLCKVDAPALCDTGGTLVGSTNVTAAAYPVLDVISPTAYVTSAGRYCWRALYNDGDETNGIAGDVDFSATECFTVNKVTPTLATTAGADVLLGNPVTDSATLTGLATDPADPVINLTGDPGPAAGGTITFKLFGPGGTCTGEPVYTSAAVPISGGAASTPDPQHIPAAPGTYHWVAVYSGSGNNIGSTHNADCLDSNEDVDVLSVPSSLTSAQRWTPNDSVTITVPAGSGNIVGNVDFKLFASGDCSGTAIYTLSDVGVTTASPTATTANTTAVTTSGSYSWLVNYDSTGNAAHRDIPDTCHETSSLTITDGGTISSP